MKHVVEEGREDHHVRLVHAKVDIVRCSKDDVAAGGEAAVVHRGWGYRQSHRN